MSGQTADQQEIERLRDRERAYLAQLAAATRRTHEVVDILIPVGIALLVERDFNRLVERIVLEARALCNADGGTLYLRTEDDRLQFAVMRTDSLNIELGGSTGVVAPFEPVPLFDPISGRPNRRNVSAHTALCGVTVNIADAYDVAGFDFSGTRSFDRRTGYRSRSFLSVPLKSGAGQVIGVIQMLNAQDRETGQVIPFDPDLQRVVEALAAIAGVALESYLREAGLMQQIEHLRIEIDDARKVRQVAEITETDYFQRLQQRASALRVRRAASGQ